VKRALLFGALWLVATAATGAAAWGAVRLAGQQTGEQAVRPMTARQVEALAASSATGPATTAAATSTTNNPVTTSAASTTSTTGAATPTTVAGTTTTAVAGAGPVVAARRTTGGTVVVSLTGGGLSLVGATPAPGFSVEVEEAGPEKVVVVFEGDEGEEIRVRAAVEHDEVSFEVEAGEDD